MITAFKDISKIIEESKQEAGGQVLELDFSSVKIFRFTEKIKSLVEQCKMLTVLKLVECELNSLQKLPDLDITGLDVSINKLKDSDMEYLTKYKNLSMLNVSDNFICTFASIRTLKACTRLKDLEMAGNQVEKLPNYREQIFKELIGLDYLDKLDKNSLPPPYDSHSDDVISDLEDQEQDDFADCQDGQEQQFQQEEEDSDSQSEKYQKKGKHQKKYMSDEEEND